MYENFIDLFYTHISHHYWESCSLFFGKNHTQKKSSIMKNVFQNVRANIFSSPSYAVSVLQTHAVK